MKPLGYGLNEAQKIRAVRGKAQEIYDNIERAPRTLLVPISASAAKTRLLRSLAAKGKLKP